MVDKQAQKYIIKLLKNLKIFQSAKNPYSFKIINLNKIRDIKKMRYTSDTDDIISECLSSYYLLTKAIFEYENYVMNTEEKNAAEKNE